MTESSPESGPDPQPEEPRPLARTVGIGAAVLVGTILLGAVIGELIAGDPPAPSRDVAVSRLQAVGVGDLLPAPEADPDELDEPRGIGSHRAGIALRAVSEVDQVKTKDGVRRAPDGGRLLAFEVGDWTCEVEPCAAWSTLAPVIAVDGSAQPLPDGPNTFVVVLPPGSEDVDLVVDADGFEQSLSLVDPDEDGENIALLAKPEAPERVRIGERFELAERTSIPLLDGAGAQTDTFVRVVDVVYAHRRFFLNGAVPSSRNKVFLIVNAFYSYADREGQNVFGPDEARFVDNESTEYVARDLDPAPATALLGFEIPARITRGELVLGGTVDRTSTTGVPYTSTLAEHRTPVNVG